MLSVNVDRVVGSHHATVHPNGFTGIGVTVKSGEVAAGYIDPDAMPLFEDVRRGKRFDHKLVNLSCLHQLGLLGRIPKTSSDDTICYVHLKARGKVLTGRININELGGKIGIRSSR